MQTPQDEILENTDKHRFQASIRTTTPDEYDTIYPLASVDWNTNIRRLDSHYRDLAEKSCFLYNYSWADESDVRKTTSFCNKMGYTTPMPMIGASRLCCFRDNVGLQNEYVQIFNASKYMVINLPGYNQLPLLDSSWTEGERLYVIHMYVDFIHTSLFPYSTQMGWRSLMMLLAVICYMRSTPFPAAFVPVVTNETGLSNMLIFAGFVYDIYTVIRPISRRYLCRNMNSMLKKLQPVTSA